MFIKLLKGYWGQLQNDQVFFTAVTGFDLITPWFSLNFKGKLVIRGGYCWDGPSKPAIRTKTFIAGSLVHDAFYQAMRELHLPRSIRKIVDQELRRICKVNGMNKFRAWYVYRWVRKFGKKSSLPRKNPRGKIIHIGRK